jgi:hypothetical protein
MISSRITFLIYINFDDLERIPDRTKKRAFQTRARREPHRMRLCSVVGVLIPRLIFSTRGSSGSRTAHSILSVDNFHTDLIPCLI